MERKNYIRLSKKYIEVLGSSPLFKGFTSRQISKMMKHEDIVFKKFRKGDVIFNAESFSKSLGCILKGRASIVSPINETTSYPMRYLEISDVFGVATLFNDDERYITEIRALSNVPLLFFPEHVVEEWIKTNPVFAMNYVSFLSNRVRFLNEKITLLCSVSNKDKLIAYLLKEASAYTESFELNISATKISKALNMGRSSIYRAIDDLAEENIVKKLSIKRIFVNYELLQKKQEGTDD